MIASCWDWSALKYAYFVIDGAPLDAGGWSPTRGILASSKGVSGDSAASIAFDDCLPTLPKNCYYAGAGDFCVGSFSKSETPIVGPNSIWRVLRRKGHQTCLKS